MRRTKIMIEEKFSINSSDESEEQSRKETFALHDKMNELIPVAAGFRIEPTALSRDKKRRERVLDIFNDEELMKFIQANSDLIKKTFVLKGLLEGEEEYEDEEGEE